jgi:hypothetical protein
MKATRRLGVVLLGIWLIVTGLRQFISFNFISDSLLNTIMAIIAIVAGVIVIFSKVD